MVKATDANSFLLNSKARIFTTFLFNCKSQFTLRFIIQGFEIKRHKETIWSNFCQLKKTILPVSETLYI